VFINIGNKNGVETPFSNVGTALSSSPGLRKAFEEAIDRAALVRVVFDGVAQSSCTPIPPANTPWFAGVSVPCTPYDPADARTLVAASGIPHPTVQLTTPNDTADLAVAQFVQSEEAAVGITVVIDSTDNATTQTLAAQGKYDVLLSGRCCDVDPNNTLLQYLETTGARNYSGYSNPRLDEVLANGLGSATMKSRIVDYHVAQQIIAADRPIIVLYGPVQEEGWSTSVAGVAVSPGSEILVANAHDL
jgi:peptide/nickel transport system substrate-binding protein